MTPWQWEQAVGSGSLIKIRQGVYAIEETDDRVRYAQRVAGALKGKRRHLACAGSAAALLGLPNPHLTWWTRTPVLLAGPKSRPDHGIRRNPGWDPVQTPWGSCTSLIDTAAGVARDLPLPQALIVVDAVARQLAGTQDRFVLASEACRTEVRRRLTRTYDFTALHLADPAAESAAESFYRGHMYEARLPEPRCGVPVRGASGRQYFIDMLLGGLAIEVDGEEKYDDRVVYIAEKHREDDLRAIGLGFLRSWAKELFTDPKAEMQKLEGRLSTGFPPSGENYRNVISATWWTR